MASPPHKKDSGDKDEALEDAPELFQESYNNSIASADTENEYLVLYFYNIKSHIDGLEEKRRKLFQNYYNNLGKPWFKTLMDYLVEHKAIMWETFSKVCPWFKEQDFYRGLKMIKPFIKKVKISDPRIITQGNQPKIYMWEWASPEDFHNEQARYAKLLLEEKEAEREFIQLKQQRAVAVVEAQREAWALKVQNIIDRGVSMLPRPLDKTKLAPVYDVMKELVDPSDLALWEDVKNGIFSRLQEEA